MRVRKLVLLSILAAFACGTDVVLPPRLELEPDAIDFGAVLLGTGTTRTLTLRNDGGGAITIEQLTLEDGDDRFSIEPSLEMPARLEGDMRLKIDVRFTAMRDGPARSVLHLLANDGTVRALNVSLSADPVRPDGPAMMFCVEGAEVARRCGFEVALESTDVPPQMTITGAIELINIGSEPLRLESVRPSFDSSRAIRFSPASLDGTLRVGDAKRIEVAFDAPRYGSERALLEVVSNDRLHPYAAIPVHFEVATTSDCLLPDVFGFPPIAPNERASLPVEIYTCGLEAVQVRSMEIIERADVFSVEGSSFVYAPKIGGTHRGRARIVTSNGELFAELEGVANDPRCELDRVIAALESTACARKIDVFLDEEGRDSAAGTPDDPVRTFEDAIARCGGATCHIHATRGVYTIGPSASCLILEGGFVIEGDRWIKSTARDRRARFLLGDDWMLSSAVVLSNVEVYGSRRGIRTSAPVAMIESELDTNSEALVAADASIDLCRSAVHAGGDAVAANRSTLWVANSTIAVPHSGSLHAVAFEHASGAIIDSRIDGPVTVNAGGDVAIIGSRVRAEYETAIVFQAASRLSIVDSEIESVFHPDPLPYPGLFLGDVTEVLIARNALRAVGAVVAIERESRRITIEDNVVVGGMLPMGDPGREIVVQRNESR